MLQAIIFFVDKQGWKACGRVEASGGGYVDNFVFYIQIIFTNFAFSNKLTDMTEF